MYGILTFWILCPLQGTVQNGEDNRFHQTQHTFQKENRKMRIKITELKIKGITFSYLIHSNWDYRKEIQ